MTCLDLSSPVFSIIIPVYNTEKYIARCLESCINQSFGDIEIIVVDDCGQDGSMQIVQDYAKKDRRIHIVHNPSNLGPLHARLAGESKVCGDFVLYLDSDDFIDTDACQSIYQAIKGEYEQTGVYPDICWFASKRLYSKKEKVYKPNLTRSVKNEVLKNNAMQWEFWGKAYGRHIVQKANEAIEKFLQKPTRLLIGEDALKSFAINLFAQKSIGIDKVLYFYCENPASITKNRDNSEIAQQNAKQLDFVIHFLNHFDTLQEAKENPYYFSIKEKVQSALKGHKEMWEYQAFIAHRFDSYPFAYPRVYFESLKIKKDFRRVCIRVFVYLITFSLVKI